MSAGHVTAEVLQTAEAANVAEKIIESIRSGAVTVDHAWLQFVELAARHGWKAAACRTFVMTLAKRAAGPVDEQVSGCAR